MKQGLLLIFEMCCFAVFLWGIETGSVPMVLGSLAVGAAVLFHGK